MLDNFHGCTVSFNYKKDGFEVCERLEDFCCTDTDLIDGYLSGYDNMVTLCTKKFKAMLASKTLRHEVYVAIDSTDVNYSSQRDFIARFYPNCEDSFRLQFRNQDNVWVEENEYYRSNKKGFIKAIEAELLKYRNALIKNSKH